MRLDRVLLVVSLASITTLAGCAGISDCGEDVAKCAAMLNANAERCAQSFQLQQGEAKRKFCEAAVKTVRKKAAKEAVPGLLQILAVPDSSVPNDKHRVDAAKALADIKDPSAVEPLMNAVDLGVGTSSDPKDKNANATNENIAEALGRLGDKRACGKLTELMKKSRHDYTVLKSVRALGEIGCKDSIGALSDIALKHDNKFMRKNAVQALGDIADPAATDTLVQMMFIEYQGVSFYPEASFSLFEIGPAVAPALLELLAGKNDAVNKYFEKTGGMKDTAIKAKAGFVLGDLRDARAVEPLIEAFKAAVAAGDGVLAVYSAAPLGALGDKRAVPVLKEQMLTLDSSQRDPFMRALVQLGDRSVVPDMILAMSEQHFVDTCVKQGLADKETCAGDKDAMQGALMAATDHASNFAGPEHAESYNKAVEAVSIPKLKEYMKARGARVEAAQECKTDVKCWIGKLSSENAFVREKAAWELSWAKDPSSLDALTKALGDKDTFVRSAAIAAYWAFGNNKAVPAIEKQLAEDEGAATYAKVNQDLKRLLVHLKRAS